MLISDKLKKYLDSVRERCTLNDPIDRKFQAEDDWLRDVRFGARSPFFPESLPTLSMLLPMPGVAILAEPGMGKSWVAKQAVAALLERDAIPVFVQLRSYQGSIDSLIAQSGIEVDRLEAVVAERAPVTFVLDGLDEIRGDFFEQALDELHTLRARFTGARILATSRPALRAHTHPFLASLTRYYLTCFTPKDIRAVLTRFNFDLATFFDAASQLQLDDDLTNPFLLRTLAEYFSQRAELPHTRAEAVEFVVTTLMSTRQNFQLHEVRRALQMIAVTMETGARNELSLEEAVLVLTNATRMSAERAMSLLDELGALLLRIGDRVAFHIRSHGEYLAASELKGSSIEKILQLLVVSDGPSESWLNTLGYLAELNDKARKHFLRWDPLRIALASPGPFKEDERDLMVENSLNRLAAQRLFIVNNQFLRARSLAKFVTSEAARNLVRSHALSVDLYAKANALAIGGHSTINELLPEALSVLSDPSAHPTLRYCALSAVSHLGNRSLIPTLREIMSSAPSLQLHLVDAICHVAEPADISVVADLLSSEQGYSSSGLSFFNEKLRNIDGVILLLRFISRDPRLLQRGRLNDYWDPLLKELNTLWSDDLVPLIVDLYCNAARAQLYEHGLEGLSHIRGAVVQRGIAPAVARRIFQQLIPNGIRIHNIANSLASFMDDEVALWLRQQDQAEEMIHVLARYCSADICRILIGEQQFNYALAREDDEATSQFEIEQQQRELNIEELRRRFVEMPASEDALMVLSKIPESRWPTLDPLSLKLYGTVVAEILTSLELSRRIQWTDELHMTMPAVLPLLLAVVRFYKLKLADDTALIEAVIADQHTLTEYTKLHGISSKALERFYQILADPNTSSGAISNVVNFVQQTQLRSEQAKQGLTAVIMRSDVNQSTRQWAIQVFSAQNASNEELKELRTKLAKTDQSSLLNAVVELLIANGDQATALSQLGQLYGRLRKGGNQHSEKFHWIPNAASGNAIPLLEKLRELSVRIDCAPLLDATTTALVKADPFKAAKICRQHADLFSPPRSDAERQRAVDIERDARIEIARNRDFDAILQKIKIATSMKLFKLWCEGPNDQPVLEALIHSLLKEGDAAVVVQPLGGWSNVQNDNFSFEHLRSGCVDAVIVMDGDKGRDWNQQGWPKPESAAGRYVRERAAIWGIDVFILERYGIENYFPQSAVEAVIRSDLSAYWPLPNDRPILGTIPNFSKADDVKVAKMLTPEQIEGTDLLQILMEVRVRAES